MGVGQEEAGAVTSTAKKERQFQVVPVPGVFTRGRWKCWDYKDSEDGNEPPPRPSTPQNQILEFDRNKSNSEASEQAVDEKDVCEPSGVIVTVASCPSEVPGGVTLVTTTTTTSAADGSTLGLAQGIPLETSSPLVLDHPAYPVPSTTPQLSVPESDGRISRPPSPTENMMSWANAMPLVVGGSLNTPTSETSVMAIDNKIEQAMDLVKTHLTFAVREEVEVLKATITELEAKVVRLEKENSLLRQVIPAEVIQQLPYLVNAAQQQQQLQQQQQEALSPRSPAHPEN